MTSSFPAKFEGICVDCHQIIHIDALARQVKNFATRAEAAESRVAHLEAGIKALADEWRYKGEYGWGPWQAGEGPDIEGQILDAAATRLRALLNGTDKDNQ